MKLNKEKYFNWSDAWVFTSIYYSTKDKDPINLKMIIGAGDMLNHSILNKEEINNGFYKLQKRGVIKIYNGILNYTDLGKLIINNAKKTNGGLFSRIDITLKKLNTNRIKLPIIDELEYYDLFTDDIIKEGSMCYINMMNKK